ncbi:hypothetical protein QR680_012192 [Steinernema hermaphroditum]|uniref:MULE transposase domain-containing protein n=1 Tax=Steinernema hermaphroditum TaxID=289476 RepID=A0AA39I2K1_9BILA|nr:hypothetical protein QR680_012192 [Steinernema hermaphroditum]
MGTRYASDVAYNVHLRKFSALAFCEEHDVPVRYAQLASQLLDKFGTFTAHEDFLEYFENTWVGWTRRNPRFEVSMWNCKAVTELELPRTNNSVESWHNAFQGVMGMQHPDVYKLLDRLLDEQVRVKAICAKLAAGEVPPLYSLVEPSDSRRLYRGATYEQKNMGKRNVFIISEAEESSDSDFAMFVDLKIRTGEGSNQLPFHPYRRPPETEGESRTTEKECEKTMS